MDQCRGPDQAKGRGDLVGHIFFEASNSGGGGKRPANKRWSDFGMSLDQLSSYSHIPDPLDAGEQWLAFQALC